MNTTGFSIGDSVRFLPGPKATMQVIAKVIGQEGAFLKTKDTDGRERKIRPGSCKAA